MCSNDGSATALVPYSLKSLADPSCTAAAYMSLNPNLTQAALEHYRLQLYNYASYADRFRYAHPALASHFLAASPYGPHGQHQALAGHPDMGVFTTALSPYKFDPRGYRVQEEPKPQHSYIGLIGMAILSSPDKKLVLSDIYQHILDNYAYFRSRGPGWRNSIRHNLSLNDCFIKAGRSANGKGHYWAIHPANIEDFKKGDFRRRKAQRRVRKHMGLAVPDDEDSSSPPPPPPPSSATAPGRLWGCAADKPDSTTVVHVPPTNLAVSRRRQFDMESLLAPDTPAEKQRLVEAQHSKMGYDLGSAPQAVHEMAEDSCSEGKAKDKMPGKDWEEEEDNGDSCLSDDATSPIPVDDQIAIATVGLSPEGRPDLCSSTIPPQPPSTSQLVSWQKTLLCNSMAAIPLNYALVAAGAPVPSYQAVATPLAVVSGGGATDALNAVGQDRRQHFDRVDQLRRMSMPSV